MGWQAFTSPPFWLAAAGVALAWLFYLQKPQLPDAIAARLKPLQKLLENKYFFDWINENIIARAARILGSVFWTVGDKGVIDGLAVNGSAHSVGFLAGLVRRVQTGYLYSYAFWMVIGLALLLGWFLVGKH
jgi:NADH-quinone oxidoreductase subunit L